MVSEDMFENVDGRRTDAGVIGILLARQGDTADFQCQFVYAS